MHAALASDRQTVVGRERLLRRPCDFGFPTRGESQSHRGCVRCMYPVAESMTALLHSGMDTGLRTACPPNLACRCRAQQPWHVACTSHACGVQLPGKLWSHAPYVHVWNCDLTVVQLCPPCPHASLVREHTSVRSDGAGPCRFCGALLSSCSPVSTPSTQPRTRARCSTSALCTLGCSGASGMLWRLSVSRALRPSRY